MSLYNTTGEIVPPHLLTVLESFLKSYDVNTHDTVIPTTTSTTTNNNNSTTSNNNNSNEVTNETATSTLSTHVDSALQIKRVPFDDLRLSLDEYTYTRIHNATHRVKQSIIICATLIDKVVNLAGMFTYVM